jgi:hypothetical protein
MSLLYATLEALRRELHLPEDVPSPDDERLLDALRAATAWIDQACGRSFAPRVATLLHRGWSRTDAAELVLREDLLELTAVEDASGVLPPDYIERVPARGPASLLRRTDGGVFTGRVHVSGIWGWHSGLSPLWLDSGDSIAGVGGISALDDTVLVTDVAGASSLGETPRFQIGQLVRAGGEYMVVTGTDPAADTITVQRGAQGTTAQAHPQGTPLDVFQPLPVVRMLALRIAAALARREPAADLVFAGARAENSLPVRPRVS